MWDLSLVDPDNRRPVDYELRRRLLGGLDEGDVPGVDDVGAAKLLVVARTLRARREHPEWFAGYTPLEADGPAAGHAVAFDRGGVVAVATRLPVGLEAAGGWQETALRLPTGAWRDLLSGARVVSDAEGLRLAPLLDRLPVALLTRDGADA
jgi:(1->4)-alpha-D-glucan 1-alpha-D-glucosylmutase